MGTEESAEFCGEFEFSLNGILKGNAFAVV
jgi:hypothetical protein